MTSRSEFALDRRLKSKFHRSDDSRLKSLFRDASGTPQVYDSEKTAKNCIGLYTKAAALIMEYTTPVYVDPTLPTLYDHYTAGGITEGLKDVSSGFLLNGKEIKIMSGSIHYFRIHPKYWRDRLRKMRACGLNCIDVYIPWNLHEPEMNKFDWGDGENDYSTFADTATFLRIVQEEDMFALVRPGPFICGEWEFGGLPSWLLRIPNLVFRTSEVQWMTRVKSYLKQVFTVLKNLQFKNGGPIIAWQVENEYGSVAEMGVKPDKNYLLSVKDYMAEQGATEMFFTSDNSGFGDRNTGAISGVLQTTNFGSSPEKELTTLKNIQPDKPLMVMEFWCGWFDHWLQAPLFDRIDASTFTDNLERILKFPAQGLNFYMFHGGTTWGFMNGGNIYLDDPALMGYQSNSTSYDYDAPLSEHGDYHEKYGRAQQLLAKYNPIKTRLPVTPSLEPKTSYPPLPFYDYLPFNELLKQVAPEYRKMSRHLKSMEMMDVNDGNGQSYGYINYRKRGLTINTGDVLKISGHVRDIAMVMVDGILLTKHLRSAYDCLTFGFFANPNCEKILNIKSGSNHTLDIFVENWGRSNFGTLSQFALFKGLPEGPVLLNNQILYDWEVSCMEFKCDWVRNLKNWQKVPYSLQTRPSMYRGELFIDDEPRDTWIDFTHWCKGVLWVNGYNLGRYLAAGPPTTLYVPGPILRKGYNEILIFEHYKAATKIVFVNKPNLGRRDKAEILYDEETYKNKGEMTTIETSPQPQLTRKKLIRSSGAPLWVPQK